MPERFTNNRHDILKSWTITLHAHRRSVSAQDIDRRFDVCMVKMHAYDALENSLAFAVSSMGGSTRRANLRGVDRPRAAR
jgi:hypothetical protein